MNPTQILSGLALIGEELALRPVDIVIDKGRITAIEERTRAPPIWICPAFFNAHTHLADTVAMDCGSTGDLVSMVTPPDGLKHRLLAAASRQESGRRDAGCYSGYDRIRNIRVRRFPRGWQDRGFMHSRGQRQASTSCLSFSAGMVAKLMQRAWESAVPVTWPGWSSRSVRPGKLVNGSRFTQVSGTRMMWMPRFRLNRISSST